MTDFNIPSIILDPQNEEEVIQRAYERIRSASNGTINDFSPSSPIAALVEGQAFVNMELLWYLNQLPTALALEVFRLLGVTRSPGQTAKGEVVFLLSTALATDFVVNAGYFIPFRDAGFVTKTTLIIPVGSLEGKVQVEATREGSDMNLAAFGLTTSGTSLTYLQTIYNPEPINGGADLEPLVSTVDRAQMAIRSRDTLISVEDYEQVAAFLLGSGSKATAYPLLMANKNSEALGHIHIFLLDPEGNIPSMTVCQEIQRELRSRSFVGASIWVSPADIKKIEMEVIIKVQTIDSTIVDEVFGSINEYLAPSNYPLGSTLKIKELEYLVRQQTGITEVVSITIDKESINTPMPNKYTQPKLNGLTVVLMDDDGTPVTFYRSNLLDNEVDADV